MEIISRFWDPFLDWTNCQGEMDSRFSEIFPEELKKKKKKGQIIKAQRNTN